MADTTTTTTSPTTTTTTTTVAALVYVETILYKYEDFIWKEKASLSGSDNIQTINTAFNSSFTFGMLSPSETSETLVIFLRVRNATTIGKIKIGLIDTGGITFGSQVFGITTSTDLQSNIVPSTYFGGVNTAKNETSSYNVSINNKTDQSSEYVYLNLTVPELQDFQTGTIRYKWFFDYTE